MMQYTWLLIFSFKIGRIFHSILLITILILIGTVVSNTFPFTNDTRQMFISLVTNIEMPPIIWIL